MSNVGERKEEFCICRISVWHFHKMINFYPLTLYAKKIVFRELKLQTAVFSSFVESIDKILSKNIEIEIYVDTSLNSNKPHCGIRAYARPSHIHFPIWEARW